MHPPCLSDLRHLESTKPKLGDADANADARMLACSRAKEEKTAYNEHRPNIR